MKETVIIGGGPVGIWTAIQLKKRNPENKITIYERFETYQRSHVLRLDHWSLILYAKTLNDAYEQKFIKSVTGTTLNRMRVQAAKSLFIKTNDLENALKTYASNIGIHIVYKKMTTMAEVEALHPDCKHFIAADGANSPFREQMLGIDSIEKRALQHIVEFKYSVSNKTKNLNLKSMLGVNNKIDFMAFEYIGRFRKSSTPISIRFFIDENTYNLIPGATFKRPATISDLKQIPELGKLSSSIETYLTNRTTSFGDTLVENSIKISKLPLNIYSAKQFAIEHNGNNWFLVGDAALGVPYFRALNSGMILGSMLAKIMNTSLNVNEVLDFQRNAYNIHRVLHINTEFEIAKGKNFVLNMFNQVRHMDIFAARNEEYQNPNDII